MDLGLEGRRAVVTGGGARGRRRAARGAGSGSAGARNAALVHLTRTMSVALGRDGITVNAIYPALTVTEGLEERLAARAEREGTTAQQLLTDLSQNSAIGRLVTADEIADVVVFLASERSAGITGEAIAVSGGAGSSVSYSARTIEGGTHGGAGHR